MDNPSLGFVGIFIPRELWLKPDLTVTEKVLLGVIDALDKGDGAWASNAYLANTVGVGERQIREYLTRLEAAGVLRRWAVDNNRRLASVYAQSNKSSKEENLQPPRQETATNSVVDKVKDKNKNKASFESSLHSIVCTFDLAVTKETIDLIRSFIDHRKEIKRPLTERALIANLETIKAESKKHSIDFGVAAKEMIDASIRNGWYGVFPVRKAANASGKKALTSEDHSRGF